MRKKSEKQKEKDRESPEKKTVRRSSRRHSKRRKHSRSSSPEAEDSGADEGEPQCRIKSEKQDEKQECAKESNEIPKSDKKKTDTSKTTEQKLTGCEEDWKEDTAFWSEDNPQGQVPNENTEQMQKNLATTEVTETDEGSQSISETGRSFVFEPKTKRTKRSRRRSATSGCEDGEAASDRTTCSEIAASSAVENEEQRGRTKSESDNGLEMSASKSDRVASDCAQGSDLSEASGGEVKLNEKSSEQGHRNSTDERSEHEGTGEEKLFVGLQSEIVQKEKTLEEKIADICNDSSCDKSDTECDNSFQTDISEGMTKEKVLELLGDDSSIVQNSSRLESDRETSDESAVQRDAIKDDSNASRASSDTPSKESVVPRRRSSSDSADLQSNRQEGDRGSSEEGDKMELLDEKKPVIMETSSPPDKQQSEAHDSTKETDSANEKNLQKTDKHLGKPHETVHSSVKNDIISSDQLKTEEVKVKPKRIKLCRTSRDSNSYTAANKETKRPSPESHENQKPVKLSRRSRSPESSQKSRRRESDPQEPRSPVHRYERVVLRRSFPEKSVSRSEGDTGTVSNDETKTDATDDKDNKENEKLASNKDVAAAGSITRKRRWGASKTSRANKKPVLSISSDSLKNLIPGAKPLSAGEVQLTEDDTCKDVKIEVEENWSAKSPEEKDLIRPLAMMPDTSRPTTSAVDDHSRFAVRKISIVSDDARTLQRSPSPPKNKVSNILFITNLVRPFTLHQLNDLLARTGTIVEDGFWIDKIKSKCYVQYETEVQARETRHALHGVRWPVSNPKQLCVDFGRKEDMEAAKAAKDTDSIPRKTDPIQLERVPPQSLPIQGGNIPLVENWVASQQLRDKERDRERERERGRIKDRATALPEQRTQKAPPAVREWDLGKVGQMSPERDSRSEERTKERERKSRKDKPHRSRSTSPSDISARKSKKKEDDAPAKLLDDLFRKTKTTPCIYWLPLTAEQIVVKEEMRRKHMAEHERRMAEMRKAERERERERARAQQRPHRRSGGGAGDRERDRERERDRRSGRRRSASGSPKK